MIRVFKRDSEVENRYKKKKKNETKKCKKTNKIK